MQILCSLQTAVSQGYNKHKTHSTQTYIEQKHKYQLQWHSLH